MCQLVDALRNGLTTDVAAFGNMAGTFAAGHGIVAAVSRDARDM